MWICMDGVSRYHLGRVSPSSLLPFSDHLLIPRLYSTFISNVSEGRSRIFHNLDFTLDLSYNLCPMLLFVDLSWISHLGQQMYVCCRVVGNITRS